MTADDEPQARDVASGTDATSIDATSTDATGTDATSTDAASTDATSGPGSSPRPSRPSPPRSAASRARRIGGAARPAQARPVPATSRPSRAEKEAGVLPPPPSAAPAKGAAAGPGDGDTVTATDPAPTRSGPPAWLDWAPATVLAAAALVMAVLIGVVSHGVWWGNDTPSQKSITALREQVLAAAKTCVVRTNSYKYTDLDTFEKQGTACTTGKQTTQFRNAVDSLIRKNAPKLKFTQTAQINKAGIESVSGNQWTVLVYGQLQVSNVNAPSGRTDPFGAIVRMNKVGGKWLIASLKTVSSPIN